MDRSMGEMKAMMMKKKNPPLPPFCSVNAVCVWALISACTVAGAIVYDAAHYGDPDPPPPPASSSRWETRIPLTEAQTLAAAAIQAGMLWLSAQQATAAAAVLVLSSDPRRRRALASVALAAAAGTHFMWAMLMGILFVAAPGNYNVILDTVSLVFIGGVFDIIAFLTLLSSSDDN